MSRSWIQALSQRAPFARRTAPVTACPSFHQSPPITSAGSGSPSRSSRPCTTFTSWTRLPRNALLNAVITAGLVRRRPPLDLLAHLLAPRLDHLGGDVGAADDLAGLEERLELGVVNDDADVAERLGGVRQVLEHRAPTARSKRFIVPHLDDLAGACRAPRRSRPHRASVMHIGFSTKTWQPVRRARERRPRRVCLRGRADHDRVELRPRRAARGSPRASPRGCSARRKRLADGRRSARLRRRARTGRAQLREIVEVHRPERRDRRRRRRRVASSSPRTPLGHLLEREADLVEILLVVERRDVDVDRALEQVERARAVGRGPRRRARSRRARAPSTDRRAGRRRPAT